MSRDADVVTGRGVFPEEGQRCEGCSGSVGESLLPRQLHLTTFESTGGFLTPLPGRVQTSEEVPEAEGGGRAAGRGVQSPLHAAGIWEVRRLVPLG